MNRHADIHILPLKPPGAGVPKGLRVRNEGGRGQGRDFRECLSTPGSWVLLSVRTVGYCRFTVDSERQIPTLKDTKDGRSCDPSMT